MSIAQLPDNIIRKSNELVVACHKLNLSEQRLLVLLASTISPNDEDFKDYELRVSDFAEMFKLELDGLYIELQNTSQSLMKQQIKFNGDNEVEVINWLSYIKYMKGSGIVKLRFDKALKPYLLQLKSHYTQYNLSSIIRFKCQYSMRIYELLKMEAFKANKRGQFERFFEISELRAILGIDDKTYPDLYDFKRYLIEPSVREVTKETDLTINDVRYGKTGRKITNMTFVVTTRTCSDDKIKVLETNQTIKPEAHIIIEATKPDKKSEDCPVINTLVAYGISPPVANTIKNTHDIEKINRNISYAVAKNQAGEIKKNFAGYLNSAIEKDYGAANQASLFDVVASVAIATKSGADISRNNGKKEVNKKEERKQVLHNFSLLSQDRQEEIQKEFLDRCCKSDAAAELIIKQTKIEGKSFYSHPIIEFRFLNFIIDNKIC